MNPKPLTKQQFLERIERAAEFARRQPAWMKGERENLRNTATEKPQVKQSASSSPGS